MFDQTFVEAAARPGRPWTIALSFTAQTTVVGGLLLIPLLHPDMLQPKVETPVYLPLAGMKQPPPQVPVTSLPQQRRATKVFVAPNLNTAPARIPERIDMTPDLPAVSQGIALGTLSGAAFGEGIAGIPNNIVAEQPKPKPAPVVPRSEPARPSGPVPVGGSVQASKLVFGPKPNYPPLARTARVQGTVKLRAVISKDGSIRDLQMISGPPLLVDAAMKAVAQWRYSPTLLNRAPVEVVTEIDVNFTLNGN